MKIKKARKLAIQSMKRERQRYAFDANCYRRFGGYGRLAFERYQELSEAIRMFEESKYSQEVLFE